MRSESCGQLLKEPVRHSVLQLGVSDPVPPWARRIFRRVICNAEHSHALPACLSHDWTARAFGPGPCACGGDSAGRQQFESVSSASSS